MVWFARRKTVRSLRSEAYHSVLDLDTGQLEVNSVAGITRIRHGDKFGVMASIGFQCP